MSVILTGQTGQLEQMLRHKLTAMQEQAPSELLIQALTLAAAMHGTIQKQFQTVDARSLLGSAWEMSQASWTSREIIRWANERVEGFLGLIAHWQATKNDSVIERAVKYIEEHYHELCRLTDAAEYVHLNASYFSVLFKKVTGDSFTSYVNRLRMGKAAMLLRNTDMKIFEIACAVGFDEPNYFTNVFRQQYHMSPKEYRKLP